MTEEKPKEQIKKDLTKVETANMRQEIESVLTKHPDFTYREVMDEASRLKRQGKIK